jgi:hypothetical protein
VVFGLLGVWWPLLALGAVWLGALAIAARGRPLDVVAAATMHLAYGIGLLGGVFRSPARVRGQVSVRSAP